MSHHKNLKADLINSVGVKWNHIYGGYFSNPEPLESFWELIETSILSKNNISLLELGSANANLCKFISGKLREKGIEVESTVVDAQENSIESIDTIKVKKVIADIIEWQPDILFDLVIMRSVLHYNTNDNQINILKNIGRLMKKESVFYNQLLSGNNDHIDFYHKIQSSAFGREIFLINEEEYIKIAREVFTEVKKIGYCPPIKVTARDLLDRFSKNDREREDSWIKLQKITGWENENKSIILQFPLFEHRK